MKELIRGKSRLIKEIYNNRRYRALFILGLYVVFFIIVFVVFEMNKEIVEPAVKEQAVTVLDKFGSMDNYKYTYTIEQEYDSEIIPYDIKGKRYGENQEFTIQDDLNGYYIENNTLYITRDNLKEKALNSPISADLLKFQPTDIAFYVSVSQLDSTTNNYTDDTIINSYILPVELFIKLYYGAIVTDEDNEFVTIKTYEKDKKIVKVEMNLTNADKYEEYPVDFHKLNFKYSDIEQVEDFTKNN